MRVQSSSKTRTGTTRARRRPTRVSQAVGQFATLEFCLKGVPYLVVYHRLIFGINKSASEIVIKAVVDRERHQPKTVPSCAEKTTSKTYRFTVQVPKSVADALQRYRKCEGCGRSRTLDIVVAETLFDMRDREDREFRAGMELMRRCSDAADRWESIRRGHAVGFTSDGSAESRPLHHW